MKETHPLDLNLRASEEAIALDIQNLHVQYGTRRILNGINFSVKRGEIRVILGGSGSGKSTCLKGILGLTEVTQGRIFILGKNIVDLNEQERNRHMQRVGVMFQNGALFGSLTVAENVALPLLEHCKLPPPVVQELVQMKLDRVGLGHAVGLYPSQLSGGMKKRAALARAMVLDPAILFCDEPSAGLDPVTSAELDQTLLELRELFQMTIVVVTHELASIETIADSIVMLGQGHVIAEGEIEQVKQQGIREVDEFFARVIPEKRATNLSIATLLGT